MADVEYTYTVSTDFPGGAVNTGKLIQEIKSSSIVTAMADIPTDLAGDTLKVRFKASLSAGDKTTLDNDATGPAGGLIAAHDNTASVSNPTIVQMDPKVKNPVSEEFADKSAGFFKLMGGSFTVGGNTTGSQDITFGPKAGVDLISGQVVSDGLIADVFTVEANPNYDLSAAGVDFASVAGAVVTVNGSVQTLLDNGLIQEGYSVRFTSIPAITHADYEGKLYEVIQYDTTANTLTLASAPSPTPTANDKIYSTRRFLHKAHMQPNILIDIGEQNPGGSYLPDGTTLRIIAQNTHASNTLSVYYNMAILIGKK